MEEQTLWWAAASSFLHQTGKPLMEVSRNFHQMLWSFKMDNQKRQEKETKKTPEKVKKKAAAKVRIQHKFMDRLNRIG